MKKKIIIALSGKMGSGKSTLAEMLKEELLHHEDIRIQFDGFAKPLRDILETLTGKRAETQKEKDEYIPELKMTYGEALQKIGQGLRDAVGDNVWTYPFKVRQEKRLRCITIITDFRYRSELKALKEIEESSNTTVMTVRLNGDPTKMRENSSRDLNHLSEIDLDLYGGWTFKYENVLGIDELRAFAKSIVVYLQHNQLI